MSATSLPYEIQREVLSYLDEIDQDSYSLVCKHWSKPAQHIKFKKVILKSSKKLSTLIELLKKSDAIKESVKEVELRSSITLKITKQHYKLIHLTPNVRTLVVEDDANEMFRVVLEAIKRGHWQNLDCINFCPNYTSMGIAPEMEEMISKLAEDRFALLTAGHDHGNMLDNLTDEYYDLVLAIKDRLSSLNLRIAWLPESADQLQSSHLPLNFTKQTRFDAVKRLTCHSDLYTSVQILDSAFDLCPNATEVMVFPSHLNMREGKLAKIEPNTKVKKLVIYLWNLSETVLDYVCRKFPKLEEFKLDIRPYSEEGDSDLISPDVSAETIARVASYTSSLKYFSLSIDGAADTMPFLNELTKLQWKGKSLIDTSEDYLSVACNKSGKKFSEMIYRWHTDNFGMSQTSMQAYLNQLDDLSLDDLGPKNARILAHCTNLQTLGITSFDGYSYGGPSLPITRLNVSHEGRNRSSLKKFLSYTPHLKIVEYGCPSRLNFVVDMPSVSFDILFLALFVSKGIDIISVHVVRSGVDRYFQTKFLGDELLEVKDSEPEEPWLGFTTMHVKVICKDIKRIETGRPLELDRRRFVHNFDWAE
ncbi:hypothetical protein BD560DRAFT_395208 [Blakeslea trispora]|nr:hypothetical protein BD560DRAFT_395208 [Blakeslea trispora]